MRRHWSRIEDKRLAQAVSSLGEGQWNQLAQTSGLQRSGKSCRLRWVNYLRPGLKHDPISEVERSIIRHLYEHLGGRWSLIASYLPGRSDNEIKNYWRCHIKEKKEIIANHVASFSPQEENNILVMSSPHHTHCSNRSTTIDIQDGYKSSDQKETTNLPYNIMDCGTFQIHSQMVTPLLNTNISWHVESTSQICDHDNMDEISYDLQFHHLWSYE